jgi:peptidoglycan/LPS O-acetylase OafA/YrhL
MQNFELLKQRLSFSHLPALDGLRFIAVFLVIFYHSGFTDIPGAHGVMIFFVLSGFLITWLLIKENEKTGTISPKAFFKRRILRIFPAFYVYSLVTLGLLLALKKEVPWTHALSSFFYLSNYFTAFHPESNNAFSHTWSLAIEEQFYLFFPFLFLLFCRNLKQLALAIGGIICLTWIWRIVLVFGFEASGNYIYSAFETRLDNLLVGCLLAIILRQESLKSFWQICLSNVSMSFVTITCLAVSIYFSQSNETYKAALGFTIEPILIAIFIAQAIAFSARGFWKWLDYKSIKFLGVLSYSLYLYQQLTTGFVLTRLAGFPLILQMAVIIMLTIVIAMISYYVIEKPFLDLKTMSFSEAVNYNWLKIKVLVAGGNRYEDLRRNLPQQQLTITLEAKEQDSLIEKRS